MEKRKVEIGDFVDTIHNVKGILIGIHKDGNYGDDAIIATSDGKRFYCPVNDLKDCEVIYN